MRIRALTRNVMLLASCQALNGTALSMVILAAPLAGHMLADDKALTTFPSAMQWVFTMVAAYPASIYMRRVGRRLGFVSGEMFYVVGGLLAIFALTTADFTWFWIASCFLGAGNGFAIFYRFAAADAAEESQRSRAISFVLAGGLVAAFIGPELAKQTRDLLAPAVFAGCYAGVIAIAFVKMLALSRLDMPRPTAAAARLDSGRPLAAIVRQPRYVIALTSSMIGWGVMVLMMASTPIAMQAHAHVFDDTAFVIQWHLIGMFAPSFFTGHLIARYGLANVMLAGAALQGIAVMINLSGVEVWNFWAANCIQGMGWNFLFVGGTTLLAGTYAREERAKAQGFNDLMVFGVAAVASFASGALHHLVGWQMVNMTVIPMIALVVAVNLWLRLSPVPQAAE